MFDIEFVVLFVDCVDFETEFFVLFVDYVDVRD